MLDIDDPKALTEFARNAGWISDTCEIRNLTVPGEGNMNRVRRAHLSDGTTLIFKQSLPCVAKYPDIPAPVERIASEHAFYARVGSQPDLAARLPKVLGFAPEAHLMCLQDLGEIEDYTRLYRSTELAAADRTRLIELLTWLGRLHAPEVPATGEPLLENQAMRQLNHEHIFALPFAGSDLALPEAAAATRARYLHAGVRDAALALGEIYLGNKPCARPSLLHGDFYPGSWVDDAAGEVFVIDPEFAFAGPPEFDCGVLCAHLSMSVMDQTEAADFVNAHYDHPPGFDVPLMLKFAAVEVLRRIWGVAQLPLEVSDDRLDGWVHDAADTLAVSA